MASAPRSRPVSSTANAGTKACGARASGSWRLESCFVPFGGSLGDPVRANVEEGFARHDGGDQRANVLAGDVERVSDRRDAAGVVFGLHAPERVAEPLVREAIGGLLALCQLVTE